ncbi:G-protein beta WD-40 repeat-containing protein [Fusarium denticulatum]|uniref:G-protein beta WD-40 repeat-containing protein n=1 Tax=Fusarium denticulatum TaxID=48507 RepID=A0A8H5XJA4_9HYPO|nr:G-protein beta WD-40 repeat-containing protein [Fusarium denticulatum]
MSGDNQAFESEEYTVGWVCALPLEMAAARGMLDLIHPDLFHQDPDDHNSYILGEINGHKTVIACLPAGNYGTNSAATVAKDLLRTFKSIRFGLMVGIGGGAPSAQHDIRLGDVVTSQPSGTLAGVVQHDRGKILPQGGFERTGSHNAPPQSLLSALARLQATHMTEESKVPEFLSQLSAKTPKRMKGKFSYPGTLHDRLYPAGYDHVKPESTTCAECDESRVIPREDRGDTDPYFHYGIIASGNQVIKDGKTRERLSQEYGALCFEMEAAGLYDFPCLVIRGICDYADSHKNKMWQAYAAATAAAFAKELLLFVPPDQVLKEKKLVSELVSVNVMYMVSLTHSLNEQKQIRKLLDDRPIDLHIVHNARYDSEDVKVGARCEPGTRARVLELIHNWADQDSGLPLLWLIGPAGTGKSTLARSIIDSLEVKKRLIAGYMFKRGEQDRNDTNRLFSTLAMQLADTVSLFKESLRNSLEGLDKDAVDKSSLESQFQKLLWDPLESLKLTEVNMLPRIIIIDALDECERPENLTRLLGLVSKLSTSSTIHLRIVITSRYAPEIVEAFEPLLQNKTVHTLELHREFSSDTTLDIRNFLKARFADIKYKRRVQKDPWPTMEDLDRLVELSTTPEPLFIYAATLCRFVSDKNRGPIQQLIMWLEQGSKSQLHQIYSPILDQAFLGFDEKEFRHKLSFLGTVILLAKPLSAKSLTLLLRTDLDDISCCIPAELEYACTYWFLHLKRSDRSLSSFKYTFLYEHLLHWIEVLSLLGRLAAGACHDLHQDYIPFLQDSVRVIVAFITIIELAPLQIYGSSIFFSPTGSMVRQRFWHQRIPKTGEIKGVEAHWSARLQVIQNSGRTVHLHTFSPNYHFLASAVESGFGESEIQLRSNINIGTHLYTLPFTGSRIEVITFSADSRHLAAADFDGHIRLWDVKSGHTQQMDIGCNSQLAAIRFSSDLNLVISVSKDGAVQYWERCKSFYQEIVTLGRNVTKSTDRKAPIHTSGIEVRLKWAALSPCMQLLAYRVIDHPQVWIWNLADDKRRFTARDQMDGSRLYVEVLTIWDVRTASKKLSLIHDHPIDAIAFSPCGKIIASSTRQRIQLWDLKTRTSKISLIEDGTVSALAFTPDGSTLASPQHLWDTTKPQQHQVFGGHNECITRIVSSPDGQLLASASRDQTIGIWNTSTLIRWCISEWDEMDTIELSFSSDGKLLASFSEDKQLRVWNMISRARQEEFPCSISDVAYSSDGQIVASTYWNEFGGEVALWEAATGRNLCLFDGTRTLVPGRSKELREEYKLRKLSGGQSTTFAKPKPAVLLQLSELIGSSELLGNTRGYSSPIFSHDGHKVAAIWSTGFLGLWEVSTGGQRRWCPIDSTVNKILFSPDSQLIAALGHSEVFLWRITGSEPPQILEIKAKTAEFFSDGKLLVVAGSEVTVWDVATGSLQHTLGDLEGRPMALCVSLDGRTIAVSSTDQFVRVWNVPLRPKAHFTLSQKETVTTIALSPNGKFLATASEHGLVRLWDTSSGTQSRWAIRPEGLIRAIKVLPNELLVSVSDIPPFFNLWNDMKLRVHRYQTISTTSENLLERLPYDIGLRYDGNWIMQGSENLLWVPPQYRPLDGSAKGWVSGNSTTIFIGSVSGHIIKFQCP